MKKKIISIFVSMLLCATVLIVAENEDIEDADFCVSSGQSVATMDPGDILIDFDAQTPTGETGSLGAEWDGEYFWSSCRGLTTPPHDINKWDIDGNLLATYDQLSTSAWGIRDLAYDGSMLYGGSEDGFWQIDPADGTSTLMFSAIAPMACIRALAWVPDEGMFYSGNFANSFYKFTPDGTTITAVTNPGVAAAYGMAYDNSADTIWIFDQTGDPQTTIWEFDHHTETLTGNSYVVPLLTDATAQLAGGLFYATDVTGYEGLAILGGMTQGTPVDRIFCMEHEGEAPAVPDLDCDGVLNWEDLQPGETAEGEFTVENIGDPESQLDWEIDSYPDWGTWSFDPENGEDLTPEDGAITVTVEVVAPDEGEEFTGEVKIVNSENSNDFCIIDATMKDAVIQVSQQVTSVVRSNGANPLNRDLIWDNGDPDFVNSLCCQRIGAVPEADTADDFTLTAEATIGSVEWESVDDATYVWDGLDDLIVYEYTGAGPGAEIIDLREVENERELLGEQFGRPWYRYTIDLVGQGAEFTLPAGSYYILLRPYSAGSVGQSFWMTSPAPAGSTSSVYFRSEYFGYPVWVPGIDVFGVNHDVSFKLYSGAGGAIPDLDCDGILNWEDLQPGETVTGEITVENIGDPESQLDWEIDSYPDWGTWSFDPENGEDLTPEDGVITITVEVTAPEEGETFEGEIKLVNSNNPDDFCIIDTTMTNPVSHPFLQMLAQRFPLLAQLLELLFF